MKAWPTLLIGLAVLLPGTDSLAGGDKQKSPREALQPFNDLIGSWRGTGTPSGSAQDKEIGFWTETMKWEWQFKGNDAWIKIDITTGKHFLGGTLRYIPAKDHFELVMVDLKKESRTYTGTLKGRVLTLQAADGADRLVFNLLHSDRFLYRQEAAKGDGNLYLAKYQVGATKEGVQFAAGDGKPECIVSGGLGTIAVKYKETTYYVCCTGCRDEFLENPEKYIKLYEENKKKKKTN